MRRLLIAILAAGVSASAVAQTPAREPGLSEYDDRQTNLSAVLPRRPDGLVGADQVLPCLDAGDRASCLLLVAARSGYARALRWDLRFFDHPEVLRDSGVLALTGGEPAHIEELIAAAVWNSLDRHRKGLPPAAALEPIRRLSASRGGVVPLTAHSLPRIRMDGYRALLDARGYAPSPVRARIDALAPTVLAAWKAEYLRAPAAVRADYPDAGLLSAALGVAGDDAGAAEVDARRKLRRRRDDQYVVTSRRASAAMAAGQLDQAYALLDRPPPAATPTSSAALAAERLRLVAAAEAGGRPDLALAMAHTAAAEAFPVNGSAPDVATLAALAPVLVRRDRTAAEDLARRLEVLAAPRPPATTPPPAFHLARDLWRSLGRGERAGALLDAWLPTLRATPAEHAVLRRVLLEEGRVDEGLAVQSGTRPAETLAEALAILGPDNPRLQAVLDAEAPERRAAAYHACALRADGALRLHCLRSFEPAAAPSRIVLQMGAIAFRAADDTPPGQPSWKDDMLELAEAFWRAAQRRDPRSLASGLLMRWQLVELAVSDLRDAGRLAR